MKLTESAGILDDDASFYRLVRRHPPRRKTCVASVGLICGGIGIEIYNQANSSLIRFLNDSMDTCSWLALMLILAGLTSGFLFGRAPKLFGIMIPFAFLSFCAIAWLIPINPAEWDYPK